MLIVGAAVGGDEELGGGILLARLPHVLGRRMPHPIQDASFVLSAR